MIVAFALVLFVIINVDGVIVHLPVSPLSRAVAARFTVEPSQTVIPVPAFGVVMVPVLVIITESLTLGQVPLLTLHLYSLAPKVRLVKLEL